MLPESQQSDESSIQGRFFDRIRIHETNHPSQGYIGSVDQTTANGLNWA